MGRNLWGNDQRESRATRTTLRVRESFYLALTPIQDQQLSSFEEMCAELYGLVQSKKDDMDKETKEHLLSSSTTSGGGAASRDDLRNILAAIQVTLHRGDGLRVDPRKSQATVSAPGTPRGPAGGFGGPYQGLAKPGLAVPHGAAAPSSVASPVRPAVRPLICDVNNSLLCFVFVVQAAGQQPMASAGAGLTATQQLARRPGVCDAHVSSSR